ncbi:hypothetical protein SPAR_01861 [Streptomyces sparsogenes DSM 40356]|uniref:Uncharacterized protein n=1 Tax=Streptomyces sparsogenes DSM 40356 TaxID=1331668 RepID=A0A1R1ST48_9ACTN|nr:hypothetical protein SPAR_01861 [Streptomyces sparsogenes DSM 40356]
MAEEFGPRLELYSLEFVGQARQTAVAVPNSSNVQQRGQEEKSWVNAYGAPVWHLRRHREDGMFDTYVQSFNAVWTTATPVEER